MQIIYRLPELFSGNYWEIMQMIYPSPEISPNQKLTFKRIQSTIQKLVTAKDFLLLWAL
jgi:hypothetical protein